MKVVGIHCENTRRVVHKALEAGWLYDGKTKSSHGRLTWPVTGEQLFFSFTPSDCNAWKRLAFDIERVSGVVVYQRVKRHAGYRPAAPKPVARATARVATQAATEAARRAGAQAAAAADRRRREIRDLMRPGF